MSTERVRLFVALELPDDVRDALIEWRSGVLRGRSGLRALAAEALHVTLCFLGWRDADEIEPIAAACERAAKRPTFEPSLAEPVWLPARRPRVLAVILSDPAGELWALQAALAGTLQAGGWYVPEARPFLAHVTVARVAKDARVRAEELPPPPDLRFAASTVTLYRSRLARGGARYEPLHSVRLADAQRPESSGSSS